MRLFVFFLLVAMSQLALQAQNSVTIGSQIWMTENLAVDHFLNGDVIPEVKSQEEWERFGNEKKPAWCYFNNNPTNKEFGRIYNWYAVTDKRGLAPTGWHIPSNEEWRRFKIFMEDRPIKKREIVFKNFKVVFGGYRFILTSFEKTNSTSYWWSTSTNDAFRFNAVYESLNLLSGEFAEGEFANGTGLPIRCLKD